MFLLLHLILFILNTCRASSLFSNLELVISYNNLSAQLPNPFYSSLLKCKVSFEYFENFTSGRLEYDELASALKDGTFNVTANQSAKKYLMSISIVRTNYFDSTYGLVHDFKGPCTVLFMVEYLQDAFECERRPKGILKLAPGGYALDNLDSVIFKDLPFPMDVFKIILKLSLQDDEAMRRLRLVSKYFYNLNHLVFADHPDQFLFKKFPYTAWQRSERFTYWLNNRWLPFLVNRVLFGGNALFQMQPLERRVELFRLLIASVNVHINKKGWKNSLDAKANMFRGIFDNCQSVDQIKFICTDPSTVRSILGAEDEEDLDNINDVFQSAAKKRIKELQGSCLLV